MTNSVTNKCQQICAECPFRRDAERMKHVAPLEPAAYQAQHGWPGFEPVECPVERATCLGWAVHLAGQGAGVMVRSTELRAWIDEWDGWSDLIFDGGNEFIRYHRGEHFGSIAWREDWKSRFHPTAPSVSFNDAAQGELNL